MYPLPRRSIGITLLSILFLWIGGFGTLVFPFIIFAGSSGQLASLLETELHRSHTLSITIASLCFIILGCGYVLYLCLGIGLWRLRRWALKGTIIVQWIGIGGGAIVALITLHYEPLLALSGVACNAGIFGGFLWYLTRPAVRWPFEAVYATAHGLVVPPAPPPSKTATWLKVSIGAAIAVALVTVFVIALRISVEKSFRSSVLYKQALLDAQQSPCVVATLGVPIIAKGPVEGSMSANSDRGEADLDISVQGPKAEGTLHAVATKSAGHWAFTDLTLMHSDGQIQLLPHASACQ